MPLLHSSRAKHTRFKAIVQRARRLLSSGSFGPNGIRQLSRSCAIARDSGGNMMERAKFVEALEANGISLSEEDVEAVMHVLDRVGDGLLDPADFIAAVRRDLTPLKLVWVIRVWYTFSQCKDGSVFIDEVIGRFNAAGHPDVVQNHRSEEDVRLEFESTFNTNTNPDGVITRQEFEQYCSGVASLCRTDVEFMTLMKGVWPACVSVSIDENSLKAFQECRPCNMTFSSYQSPAEKLCVSSVRDNALALNEIICNSHRPAVMQSPLAVRKLSIALRMQDTGRNYFLPREVFLDVLRRHRLYLNCDEGVLSLVDTIGDGSVDYLFYLNLLLPPLPPARLMMLERLWELFLKDTCGAVDVLELHKRFRAGSGEEQNEFLAAWDVRVALHRRVTLEEIVEWHTPLSEKYELDKDFEAFLKRQWDFS
uniref:EF-hand domain-containing protein n=1 Tax=Trypanosoma congolense (strain IL3000) TaxID=1068625 RepID=G0UKZ9_TRYCI|nr:conserved hypothetical protein [Trypanosoma congolense IL3000]